MKKESKIDNEFKVNTIILLLLMILIPGVRLMVLSMICIFVIPVICIDTFDYFKGKKNSN
ncbi:hypothetical protein ASU66_02020 [Enterobacter hormaechei subsp. xiangfangensis]|nr:hypothetical protein ASU66_02020 [Enterobacter hormaechei subsp. xiangfangensis]